MVVLYLVDALTVFSAGKIPTWEDTLDENQILFGDNEERDTRYNFIISAVIIKTHPDRHYI